MVTVEFDREKFCRSSLQLVLKWFLIMIHVHRLTPESAAEMLVTIAVGMDLNPDEEFEGYRPTVAHVAPTDAGYLLNYDESIPPLHGIVYPMLHLYQQRPELFNAQGMNSHLFNFEEIWEAIDW